MLPSDPCVCTHDRGEHGRDPVRRVDECRRCDCENFNAAPSRIQITRNAARCRRCDQVIESRHRHDLVRCRCGAIAVDGGRAYLRRIGDEDACEDLSEFQERQP